MKERFDNEMLELAAARIREGNLREIERAIDRIKEQQTEWDDSFRREWFRAAWKRTHHDWRRRKESTGNDGGVQNDG